MMDALKQKLQAEVERLNHEISFILPKEIEKARAHGDLRENSEYKAALERQQFTTARLSQLRARLGKIRCPTLVVAGDRDRATPAAMAETLAGAFRAPSSPCARRLATS